MLPADKALPDAANLQPFPYSMPAACRAVLSAAAAVAKQAAAVDPADAETGAVAARAAAGVWHMIRTLQLPLTRCCLGQCD